MHGPDKNGHVTNQQLGRAGQQKMGGSKNGRPHKGQFFQLLSSLNVVFIEEE